MSASAFVHFIKDGFDIISSPFRVTKNGEEVRIDGYRDSLSSNAEIPSRIGRFRVTSVASRAFANCSFLDKIWIRSGVRVIGPNAFSSCRRLSQVHFDDDVDLLDHDAFYECRNLYWVELPGLTGELGDRCFYGCSGLKDIALPDSLKRIGDYAFSGTGIQSVKLPLSLEFLSRTAFENCPRLENIYLTKGSYADSVLKESPLFVTKLRYVPQI